MTKQKYSVREDAEVLFGASIVELTKAEAEFYEATGIISPQADKAPAKRATRTKRTAESAS